LGFKKLTAEAFPRARGASAVSIRLQTVWVEENSMDFSKLNATATNGYSLRLRTIDSHTEGEPTRLIVSGFDAVPGDTMKDKLSYYKNNLDHIRHLMTWEPRGHRHLLAAQVTEPATEGAHFGLIYMDARRYPFLCGHATIGAVTTLVEIGAIRLEEPVATVIVDTPSGPMSTRVHMKNGRVQDVTMRMVPSFVYETELPLKVPKWGQVRVDTVCVGGFFVMVSSDQLPLALIPENHAQLIEMGMTIIEMANEQLKVSHPTRSEVASIDVVEFYQTSKSGGERGKSIVIYGESHMDRSPCGTGTTAKMTLLHHQGKLSLNEPYYNCGPLGTTFEGRIVREDVSIGDCKGVEIEITGKALITGFHEFVLEAADPFQKGFLL
jgi:proline racemase